MKVFLTIWITAVLIQEVIPGTLVRLPRHTPKHPALVETEYEAKYEQTGQNGNENSGLFSGKQEIVHDGCPGNWNAFADKCAALVKDLVASLAGTVSSRPGDATKLQLQIKNTFRHFDNTHNCSCLTNRGKNNTALDLSYLLNNITINTIAPTMNNNRSSTGAENEHEKRWGGNGQSSNGNNGSGLREGVVGLGSNGDMMNGDGDDGNGSSDGRDNNIGTLHSHPAGVSRKINTTLDHAKNPGFSPENDEDSEAGSNNRRQAEYPQVSWQPGNKARHSHTNHGKSNNINRSLHPFIVTPQPNSPYESPTQATYSDGNEISSNGGKGSGSDGQTNSNASPEGGSGESSIPSIQTLPATKTYNSEPTFDSHYKAGVRDPATGSHNSPYPTGTGVPPAFDHHYGKVPGIPAPGGHNLKNGYSHSKAPVTDDNYDSKPVPVQPITNGLSSSKFPTNHSPNPDSYSDKPHLVQSTSTTQTSENPHSSDSHALPKNQHNRHVAEIIQPASSLPSEDSSLNSIPRTPNVKPFLTTGKPKASSSRKNKKVRVPVINSHSNIPESREPESQWGTTNPLTTGGNPNPSTADPKTGSPAIPEVLPASINDESHHTVFSPTTTKSSHAKTLPLDPVPPSVYVKPTLPEAYNHKSEDTSTPVAVTSSSQSQNSHTHTPGGSGSENLYGDPQMDVPVTVYPVYMATTMSPLGYNVHVKPEENSGSNGNYNPGKSNTEEEDDCDENDPEDGGETPETVLKPPEQSLQHTGRHQPNTEVGHSSIQNGQSTSVPNTNPDLEEYEDCDETTDSDSTTNKGTGNDETAAVTPPVHPVSKISDPVVQVVQGNVPASDDHGENMRSSVHPNGLPGSSSGTTNGETTAVPASQVESVPTASDPDDHLLHENVPAHDDGDDGEDCDENTELSSDATHPITESPVMSDPVQHVVQGHVPASDDHGESMRSSIHPNNLSGSSSVTGTTNGETTSVPASQVPTASDPNDHLLHENVPAPDDGDDGEDCDENTELSSDATHPITESPVMSDPVQQVVQVQHVPASDDHGENTGSSNNLNSPSDSGSNTNTPDAVSQVKHVPDTVSLSHENVPDPDDDEDCDEETEPSNDATNSVATSPVKPVSTVSDPVVKGNDGSENMESDIHRNGLSGTSPVRGTVNDETTPVVVFPIQPVSTVSDPVGSLLHENVPDPDNDDDCDEDTEPSNDPTTSVSVSQVKHIPKSDPEVKGNVPASDDGGENMSFNQGVNHATTSPVQPTSEPAGQSLHSGGSPQSSTGSGVDGVQNGNIHSPTLNVTPLPVTNSPDGDTLMSNGSEGNPGNEDSALYQPTTFQTTATDPTPPQSILIPTESTGRLTPLSPDSHSTVGDSTSPLSKEGDDDDEDEDCCSCESCTDDVGDVKLYKENACKNLEEARRELKAIFDRIKKKLKCGRKV